MIRPCKYLIPMAVLAMPGGLLWGRTAQADDPAPPASAPAGGATTGAIGGSPSGPPGAAVAGATSPTAVGEQAGLSDEQVVRIAEGESIEIFDERPDKPFDRDTEIRLTGAELAARGATDLATALALLPDVTVRDAGRGGFNIDIRGARKGAVSVLIDGVLVTDPYYGTFDVSTIPVTDIVQIRVATTPQSPLDGPGGPGGVIEVHTRDAIGPQLVIGRITADSLPSVGMTGTARVALARHLALRFSASGLGGARDLELPGNAALGEERRSGTGSARLEYRDGDRRIAIDGFLDDRHYVSPPSDTTRSTILLIDRETSARASAKLDDKIGETQIQSQVWTHYLERRSRFFADPAMTTQQQVENLKALRSGAMALVTRPFWRDFRWALSTTVDFEKAAVSNIDNVTARGTTTLIEPAGDLQFEHKRFRIDVAGGVAVPFGVGADPWPEAKAVAKYRFGAGFELSATGAYKGRVPSLRERFDLANGNTGLGPERIAHGELRAIEHLSDLVHLEVAPYYKRSTGTIRGCVADTCPSDDPMDQGQLINLGVVTYWGVDAQARITPHPVIELGGGYEYIKARSDELGDDPLDRLPHNRWEGWAQARPTRWLSAIARVKYFGQAIDQAQLVDGYTLVEANVTAQVTRQYMGVLRVDDLLDAQPQTRAGYHTAGRVVSLVMQGTWE